jgi:predicted Ser/Thr protein kinase
MPLVPGTRLGPHEVLAPLGKGGMGEVYKGRDTRLNRTVALKVLTGPIASDPLLRHRFDREARMISSLNHPHICALYDVGRQDGVDFLVMEYVEGETLATRLSRGAIPLDDALRYAIQIADALDKAHRTGIVHRDLKPANIMLAKAGIKLLDFGIARLEADATEGRLTGTALTAEYVALGTPEYMAPEQIEGKVADARADLFAFGLVLYEMLTGRKAFQAPTTGALVAAILHQEPPAPSTIQPTLTGSLDWTVARCLAKDREERWQSARDLLAELKRMATGSAPVASALVSGERPGRQRVAWAVAGGALLSLVAIAGMHFAQAPPTAAAVRFPISAPDQGKFEASSGFVAVSPDGQRVAFVARGADGKRLLWVRPLNELTPQPLAGTDDASFPFWSRDGHVLAFFADAKLKRINAEGGDLASSSRATRSRWSGASALPRSRSSRALPFQKVEPSPTVP